MTADKLKLFIPILRDIVFLTVGTYVFVAEARAEARWEPMLLGMLFAAGPTVVSAYWSLRSPDSGSSASLASPSSPPLPSPSSSGGEP